MKKSGIFWYSLVFFGLSFFAFSLVLASMTDGTTLHVTSTLKEVYQRGFKEKEEVFQIGRCSPEQALVLTKISSLSSLILRNLSEYELVCGSLVTKTLIVSTDLPKDVLSARRKGEEMAETLAEFSSFGIDPVVLVDPSDERGPASFQKIVSGAYDPLFREYFSALREKGIRDEAMGMWIPFPSANLPKWNHANISPKEYTVGVNRYLGILKEIFPDAKGGLLLSSSTYENDRFEWSDGEYASLVPYVSGIQPQLVESLGIEGFPWMPPRESGRFGVLDAREYLNAKLAMEAADTLGIRDIRFFTGTFSEKYTLDSDKKIVLDPGRRKDMLNGIIAEVESAKKKGYSVSMTLFVADESASLRATNWSYRTGPVSYLHQSVFVDFVAKMNDLHIPISLDTVSR